MGMLTTWELQGSFSYSSSIKGAIEWKTVFTLAYLNNKYVEMTYREPQTPLFPPPYVNLMQVKDH